MAWNQLLYRRRYIPSRIVRPLPEFHIDLCQNRHSIGFSMALYYRLLDFSTRRSHIMAALYQAQLPIPTAIHQLLCIGDWVNFVSDWICLFHPRVGDGGTRGVTVYNRISSHCVLAGVENM